jgi:hypothetical protein
MIDRTLFRILNKGTIRGYRQVESEDLAVVLTTMSNFHAHNKYIIYLFYFFSIFGYKLV